MSENKFYDIHCHLMNMRHPYIGAFLRRATLSRYLLINSMPIMNILISRFLSSKIMKVENLLSIMENDIASMLIQIEEYIKTDTELYRNGKLHIGRNAYSKLVLTPLIMDFGYSHIENKYKGFYSKKPSYKPVVEQVSDMFDGIRLYTEKSDLHLFEVYPFWD